jgi:hypothetical protein
MAIGDTWKKTRPQHQVRCCGHRSYMDKNPTTTLCALLKLRELHGTKPSHNKGHATACLNKSTQRARCGSLGQASQLRREAIDPHPSMQPSNWNRSNRLSCLDLCLLKKKRCSCQLYTTNGRLAPGALYNPPLRPGTKCAAQAFEQYCHSVLSTGSHS